MADGGSRTLALDNCQTYALKLNRMTVWNFDHNEIASFTFSSNAEAKTGYELLGRAVEEHRNYMHLGIEPGEAHEV